VRPCGTNSTWEIDTWRNIATPGACAHVSAMQAGYERAYLVSVGVLIHARPAEPPSHLGPIR
jgi:hypothetical protein